MRLHDLDSRFVPWAAQKAAALRRSIGVRRVRTRAAWEGLSLRDLKDLDERFASRGVLGLMRDVPQVGFVVIAVVFLAGAGTALSRESARDRQSVADQGPRGQNPNVQGPAATGILGPAVGARVPAYLNAATAGLRQAKGDDDRLALVSFSHYRTAAQVEAMLSGVEVRRVYLRVKAAGRDAGQVPVEIQRDLRVELTAAFATSADRRQAAQVEFQKHVDTLDVTTPEEQAFKNQYAAFARSSGIEARAYRTGCACVFAAVVETSVASLQQLRSRPGVRGVEVAGPDQPLRELQVLTLLPETKATVPARQADPAGQ